MFSKTHSKCPHPKWFLENNFFDIVQKTNTSPNKERMTDLKKNGLTSLNDGLTSLNISLFNGDLKETDLNQSSLSNTWIAIPLLPFNPRPNSETNTRHY